MLAKNHRIIKKLFIIALIVLNSSLFGDLITAQKSKPVMSMSSLVTAEICRMVGEKSLSFKIDSRTVMMEPNRELLKFYKDGKCHPVWSNEKVIDTQAIYLLYSIKESTKNGLDVYNPDYHYENIVELLNFITPDSLVKNNPSVLAQLDILLTDAYMKLGRHLSNGLVPHESIAEVWKYSKHSSHNMSLRLSEALDNKNVKESLEELSSSSYGYQELTKVMMNYLRIQEAGGWKKVEAIGRDEKGDDQYAFDDVKARLRVEGDLVANDDSIEAYEAAVKNFQRRHGINADGVIGVKTLSKMNISVEEKITAIRLNMEKWRWMPDEKNMYVSVNIPDFFT